MFAMDLNNSDKQLSDFSIDHILSKAGASENKGENNLLYVTNQSACPSVVLNNADFHLPWLQCTRYYPPKLPRHAKKEGPIAKRQLGRHPRIPFTSHQLSILEDKFKERPYVSSDEVTILSKALILTDVRVKIWFQNRRARERREQSMHLNVEESSRNSSALNYNKEVLESSDEKISTLSQSKNMVMPKTKNIYLFNNKETT